MTIFTLELFDTSGYFVQPSEQFIHFTIKGLLDRLQHAAIFTDPKSTTARVNLPDGTMFEGVCAELIRHLESLPQTVNGIKKFWVVETDEDRLDLFVWDQERNNCVWAHKGFGTEALRQIVENLLNGADPVVEGWNSNVENPSICLNGYENGFSVICTENGMEPFDEMCASGQAVFYPEEASNNEKTIS